MSLLVLFMMGSSMLCLLSIFGMLILDPFEGSWCSLCLHTALVLGYLLSMGAVLGMLWLAGT